MKSKLILLGQCEGISELLKSNLQNHAKKIERASIALISVIISPEDLNRVICMHCGICPKVVNSDGNAKGGCPNFSIDFCICMHAYLNLVR